MWNRRTFLRALGLSAGGSLLTPLVNSVYAADGTKTPKRFVIFVEGNGIEPRTFASSKTLQTLEQDKGGPANQRYLYKDYEHDSPLVTMNAGLGDAISLGGLKANGNLSLEDRSAVLLGLSSKIAGGGHSSGHRALSCSTSSGGIPSAPTIETILSNLPAVQDGSPFSVIRLGVAGAKTRLNYATCALGSRRPAPIITSPTTAFNTLFGAVSGGTGRQRFEERSQLLDFATKDVKATLAQFPGNSVERQKLEAYLASLEIMVKRQGSVEQVFASQRYKDNVELTLPSESPLFESTAPLERMQAHVDMVTSALIGGLTNTALLSLGTGSYNWSINFNSLASMFPAGVVGGHDLKHAAEDGKKPFLDIVHAITRRNVDMLAKMARTLANTPEIGADGSMLDHTLILYMSDNGEKHHSRAEEWPILMIGGQKLGFKTDGRSVIYPKVNNDNNRQVSNVFNSLGHAAGMDLNDFGNEGEGRIAKGPLSEIWSS